MYIFSILTECGAGYDDEQVVRLDELRNSDGEEAIEEQIVRAKQECEEDDDYEEQVSSMRKLVNYVVCKIHTIVSCRID